MRRRTILIAVAAVAVLLAGGWYWGSPWWTLYRMREAARARDYATLGTYVDARAIGADWIKGHRRSRRHALEFDLADIENARRLIATARRQLGKPDGEPGFRLEDVGSWLSGIPTRPNAIGGGKSDPDASPYIRHQGLDGFELHYRGSSEDIGPVMGFRREGLGWKLVRVRFGQQ